VSPLPVPPADAPAEQVRTNATVRLFVQRAKAAQPMFELTAENLEPVAEICRRVDGLPLAVELAAARVRLLPPDLLLERLGTRLDLLASGAADMPERQRTLWSAIDWSFNLLSAEEQELFSQLAVFIDGWTLDAAEAVCVTANGNVLDTLVSLLEKSLLIVVGPVQAGEPRMRMLAPVHEFAGQKLAVGGERRTLQQRHAEYFGNLVAQHQQELRGAGQEAWSRRLSAEGGNLRAAVNWWIENADGEALGRFLWATNIHYWMTGDLQEYASWVRAAETFTDGMSRVTRGRLRIVQGYASLDFVGIDQAARALEEALSLLDGSGEESDILMARILLIHIMGVRGDPSAADALQHVLDSPSLRRDPWLFAMAHWIAGGFALFAGDLEQAEIHSSQAIALGRELGNWLFVGMGLERLAFVHLRYARTDAAASALKESVDGFRRVHYREGLAYDLQGLAHVLAVLGDARAATEALAGADGVHALLGHSGPLGMWSAYKPDFDALRDELHAVLGDQFTDVWVLGRAMDAYTAADNALNAIEAIKENPRQVP
jgi:hypothetical protein